VYTNKEVMANKTAIIIKNIKMKICILVDEAMPADGNATQKEAEKEFKYKSLCIEVNRC